MRQGCGARLRDGVRRGNSLPSDNCVAFWMWERDHKQLKMLSKIKNKSMRDLLHEAIKTYMNFVGV